MPNMDGAAMIRFMHQSDQFSKTAVLVVTGSGDIHSELATVRELSVIEVLEKPVAGKVLSEFVERGLHHPYLACDGVEACTHPGPSFLAKLQFSDFL